MSKRCTISGPRPPYYCSKAILARELSISETTVDSLVQRGELPRPIRLGGCIRWEWAAVEAAITARNAAPAADPFMRGIENVR